MTARVQEYLTENYTGYDKWPMVPCADSQKGFHPSRRFPTSKSTITKFVFDSGIKAAFYG